MKMELLRLSPSFGECVPPFISDKPIYNENPSAISDADKNLVQSEKMLAVE